MIVTAAEARCRAAHPTSAGRRARARNQPPAVDIPRQTGRASTRPDAPARPSAVSADTAVPVEPAGGRASVRVAVRARTASGSRSGAGVRTGSRGGARTGARGGARAGTSAGPVTGPAVARRAGIQRGEISCCGSSWVGAERAHCCRRTGGCGQVFDDARLFDRHRRYNRCVDPAELGLVDGDGIWAGTR